MSTRRALIPCLILGVLLACFPAVSHADDSPLGAIGFAVVPLDHSEIALAAERVEAEIRGREAWVTCHFTFTNTGPKDVEVLMGFPQVRPRYPGEAAWARELRDFRAWVDGTEIPVTFRPQAEGQDSPGFAGWHAFSVHFAAGQTRVVRNSYHGSLGVFSGGSDRSFTYILQTGAAWAGLVGRAEIVVRWLRDRDVVPSSIQARPGNYVLERRQLRWLFTDFEPSVEQDIEILFAPVGGIDTLGASVVSSGDIVADTTGYGPPFLFADGDAATAWISRDEAGGAWMIWSCDGFPNRISPTLGLGILPGVGTAGFRQHGRPKDVLLRLAVLTATLGEARPVRADPGTFLHPPAQLKIIEHRMTLQDAARWQFLHLQEPAVVLAFQVVVVSVYPGEAFHDVAIAELRFPLLREDLAALPAGLPGTGGGGSDGLARAAPDEGGTGKLFLAIIGATAIRLGTLLRLGQKNVSRHVPRAGRDVTRSA